MAVTTIGSVAPAYTMAAAVTSAEYAAPSPSVSNVSSAAPAGPAQSAQHPQQLQEAVESMRRQVEVHVPNSLAFSLDSSTGETIVKITDTQTGAMIRQIPSKEALEIARSIEQMQSLLLPQKA
ncbi:MAG: flagellar protein FlaG [Proteobacteria bacterium]|nr:flagellar protein FlaG [Pseudomonadota bacterium]HQR02818.1 flagellar protein FlaG [Rhodocyclaceae bacterium]